MQLTSESWKNCFSCSNCRLSRSDIIAYSSNSSVSENTVWCIGTCSCNVINAEVIFFGYGRYAIFQCISKIIDLTCDKVDKDMSQAKMQILKTNILDNFFEKRIFYCFIHCKKNLSISLPSNKEQRLNQPKDLKV